MDFKQLIEQALLALLCATLSASCVDQSYDLDKINDDVSITWESLSVPIGSMKPILFSDMIDLDDYGLVTVSPSGDYSVAFSTTLSRTVKGAALVDGSHSAAMDMPIDMIDTKGLSEIFQEGSVLDLDDIIISLDFKNELPVDGIANTDLCAFKDGKVSYSTHLGPLDIKASGTSSFVISRKKGIIVNDLTDMLKCMPDSICFKDSKVVWSQDVSKVNPQKNYRLDLDIKVEAPLSAGKDLSVTLEHRIRVDATMDSELIGSAIASFTVTNSIPLNMSVEAQILDEYGAVSTSSQVTVKGGVEAGTPRNTTTNDLVVEATPGKGLTTIGWINLIFHATGSEAHEGICLSNEQGITLSNISLTLNKIHYQLK